LLLIVLTTAVFWVSGLDITVTSLFYEANSANHWPLARTGFWRFFYEFPPRLSLFVAVACLLVIMVSALLQKWRQQRKAAYFVLAVFVVGPGILVNGIFKDHWGRPRPDQIAQFGGVQEYVPPGYFNAKGDGKSFPSGHSSVGFAFIAFWFLCRRRNRLLGWLTLYGTLLFGSLIGFSRIADGAHFLSDVLWSAWIPIWVAIILYHQMYTLEESKKTVKGMSGQTMAFTVIAIIMVIYSLTLFPVEEKPLTSSVDVTPGLTAVCLVGDFSELHVKPSAKSTEMKVTYQGKGFGLAGSHINFELNNSAQVLRYEFEKNGFFSEWYSKLSLDIPGQFAGKLIIISEHNPLPNNGADKQVYETVYRQPGQVVNECLP